MNILKIIEGLTNFPERQGASVVAAGNYIQAILQENNISYTLNAFIAKTPLCTASLTVNGRPIACRGCSFVGGVIASKDCILSSTTPSRFNLDNANINFNPYADEISCANFYFAPAIAVSRNDIPLIITARDVKGEVAVTAKETKVSHILAGNLKNPRAIVFAHYDSISTGALDNASGVAVALACLVNNPELLQSTLFVFDPCEELSFDKPTYWGHGFRVFEEQYPQLMENAERLIPVDCVGNGPIHESCDPKILRLAFPIRRFEEFQAKIVTLYSDIGQLMAVYHSPADTIDTLSEAYLAEALRRLVDKIA